MRRAGFVRLALMLLIPSALCAQRAGTEWVDFASPRYAEAVRMGGLYTAVGRGLAAVHHNPAALAFQDGLRFAFSHGRSTPPPYGPGIELRSVGVPFDAALSGFIPAWNVTLAADMSHDRRLIVDWSSHRAIEFEHGISRVGLHVAMRYAAWLAFAVTLRGYESTYDMSGRFESADATARTVEPTISAHARVPLSALGSMDELRMGCSLENLFASDISYIDKFQSTPIHQVLRIGSAYFWYPGAFTASGHRLLAALLTLEGSLHGGNYSFDSWSQYGIGAEIRVYDVLMLSAGWEDRDWIPPSRRSNGYPLLRWGMGLVLPLHVLWAGDLPVFLQIDVARTTWSDALEREGMSDIEGDFLDTPLWSVQLFIE